MTERVLKSWEPYLPEILARVPSDDLRALLDKYGSLVAMLRVGVMPYTADIVDAAMAAGGQVEVTTGRVDEIRGTEAGTLVLSISGPAQAQAQAIEADLVISNFGRESDYERVSSRLWVNLLRNGIASVHRRTGRGVEVDDCGNLVGATGAPSGPVSVVGSPREGDEIVRNGRMGAFTFNLAAIKNHSVEVAATALCRLETCYGEARRDADRYPRSGTGSGSVLLDRARRAQDDRQASRRPPGFHRSTRGQPPGDSGPHHPQWRNPRDRSRPAAGRHQGGSGETAGHLGDAERSPVHSRPGKGEVVPPAG